MKKFRLNFVAYARSEEELRERFEEVGVELYSDDFSEEQPIDRIEANFMAILEDARYENRKE